MTKTKQILSKILCFALIIIIGGGMYLSAFSLIASAAETQGYSNVIDDLSKDESFKLSDYPDKPGDYSLDVIHVAEGVNGEVYVYVYQPSDATKDLKAAKINMSLLDPTDRATRENEASYSLYNLTWLNSYGTLDKYVINDFKKSNDAVRYYSIAGVYRKFDTSLGDKVNADDDIGDYKGYPVGLHWAIRTYNDEVQSVCNEMKIVELDNLSVGFTRYYDGWKFVSKSTDSHFIGFSVPGVDIEKVFDADVTYTYQHILLSSAPNGDEIGEEITVPTYYVSSVQTGENEGFGLFGKKYTWNRIVPTSQFVEEIEDQTNEFLNDEHEANLDKTEFVIRFVETNYEYRSTQSLIEEEFDKVTKVGVLRLHYLDKAGNEYNVGVVSDIISDDGVPDFVVDAMDNLQNTIEELMEKGFLLIAILILISIVIITIFNPLVMAKLLIKFFVLVFKGILLIISIPFKLILLPFRKNKRE